MKNLTLILITFLASLNMLRGNVTLLFPDNNEELTDVAVSFKAKITSDGPYVLYACKNEDFTGEVLTQVPVTLNGVSKSDRDVVYFLTYQGKLHPDQKFVLPAGEWFWRISGDDGTTFSETRKLTVNDEHSTKPAEMTVNSDNPIFHARLRGWIFDHPNPEERLARIVPEELKEYFILDINTSFPHLVGDRSLFDYCKLFNDAGYKFYFDLGAHQLTERGRIASLGEMEKIFRELPNCVGASTAEQNYFYPYHEADNSLQHGTLQLCRKYGKHFFLADMNWNWPKWQFYSYRFYDIFMEEGYSDYFIPLYKTTDPWGTNTCVSAIQGMKTSGMVKNIGIWSDMWCWEKLGQVNTINLTDWMAGSHTPDGGQNAFPFIANMKFYIWGMTYGSTVFGLEPTLWGNWETCEPNDFHSRYMVPFMKAVIEEDIIPDEKAINDNFNVVIDTEFKSGDFGTAERLSYLEGNVWGDLLRNTYGISDIAPYNEIVNTNQGNIIQAAYTEIFPNTDRYPSGIPYHVKPSASAPIVNGRELEVVKLSDMVTKQGVDANLNQYYPESQNEAYAQIIDSSIFVFNTIENHDIKQHYKVDIQYAGIDSLYGDIPLLNYIMGRLRSDGKTIFFQTNAHIKNTQLSGGKYNLPNYPSKLSFKCQAEPTLESDEMSAITKSWDSEKGILSVEINHTTAGAVNFTLAGDESISYDADSVAIEKNDIDIYVHDNAVVSGTIYPENLQGVFITWKSLNPAVASVSPKGLITGNGDGTCKIVALAGGQSDTLEIKVTEIKVSEVKISEDAIYMEIGDEINLSVELTPENASFTSTNWMVKRSSIASIDEEGKVIAKRNGETYVVVTHESSGLTDTCFVYVGEQTPISKSNTDNVVLYPNPSKGLLYIKGIDSQSKLTILSLSGSIISYSNKQPLVLHEIKQGTYILRIESKDQIVYRKFIKQ